MNNNDLQMLLDRLITEWENEVVEFKHAGNDYDTDRIGRYFSAMCNEANLRDIEGAWLVFGVDNKTRNVIGSDYRDDKERLQSLKMQMAENTEPSVTMRNIHVLHHADGRVVLFVINGLRMILFTQSWFWITWKNLKKLPVKISTSCFLTNSVMHLMTNRKRIKSGRC